MSRQRRSHRNFSDSKEDKAVAAAAEPISESDEGRNIAKGFAAMTESQLTPQGTERYVKGFARPETFMTDPIMRKRLEKSYGMFANANGKVSRFISKEEKKQRIARKKAYNSGEAISHRRKHEAKHVRIDERDFEKMRNEKARRGLLSMGTGYSIPVFQGWNTLRATVTNGSARKSCCRRSSS